MGYEILQKYGAKWYVDAPVMLSAAQLLRSADGRVLLQAKFRVHTQPVTALSVRISCRDSFGEPAGDVTGQYQDIQSQPYGTFGQDRAMALPVETRQIEILLERVKMADGSLWQGGAAIQSVPVPTQQPIGSILTEEQEKILRWHVREKEPDLPALPQLTGAPAGQETFWQCWCGACNPAGEACHACGWRLEDETRLAAPDFLEEQAPEWKYDWALAAAKGGKAEDYRQAAGLMHMLGDYRDAAELEKKFTEYAEAQPVYEEAKGLAEVGTLACYREAAKQLERIPNYKDAAELREEYLKYAEDLEEQAARKKAARKRKCLISILIVCIAALLTAAVLLTNYVFIPLYNYNKGIKQREAGEYEASVSTFTVLGDYKDSSEQIRETRYQEAQAMMDVGDYENAGRSFYNLPQNDSLGYYKDSLEKGTECYRLYAQSCFDVGDYTTARTIIKEIPDYQDSSEIYNLYLESAYQEGLQYMAEGDYYAAVDCFGIAADVDYQDSSEQLKEAKYQYAISHMDPNDIATDTYLGELKVLKYKDSSAQYDRLEGMLEWEAIICIHNDKYSYNTHVSRVYLGNYTSVYVDITIYCDAFIARDGRKSIPVKAVTSFKGDTNVFEETVSPGGRMELELSVSGSGSNPSGTYTVKVYNENTGELIGSASSEVIGLDY